MIDSDRAHSARQRQRYRKKKSEMGIKSAKLLKPGGLIETVRAADNEIGFTRDELTKHLECEWLEFMAHPDQRNKSMLIFDEEGKVHKKVTNQQATEIMADEFGVVGDYLVGNVLLVDEEFLEK